MAEGTESTNKHHWDAPGVNFVIGVLGVWGIGVGLLVGNIVGVGAIFCLGSTAVTIIRYLDLFKSPFAARRKVPAFEAALVYIVASIEISLPLILTYPRLFPPSPSVQSVEAAKEAEFASDVELLSGMKIRIEASGDDAESVRRNLMAALRKKTKLNVMDDKDQAAIRVEIETKYLPYGTDVYQATLSQQITRMSATISGPLSMFSIHTAPTVLGTGDTIYLPYDPAWNKLLDLIQHVADTTKEPDLPF